MSKKITENVRKLILDDYANGLNQVACAKKYGYTQGCIRQQLLKNKITIRPKIGQNSLSIEIKEEICKLYKEGKTVSQISKIFNREPYYIYRILQKNKVCIRNPLENKRNTLNENYFNIINTEDRAYFLGLLMADGCNNRNGFTISLQEEDRHILEKFKECINFTGRLYEIESKNPKWKNEVKLDISSKNCSIQLCKHGIIPRKTHFADLPTTISDNLIHHFIRGVFDGDGCVHIRKDNSGVFNIVGNDLLLNKIREILATNCNINKTKIAIKNDGPKNIVSLRYSGNLNCIKIRTYLYKDATIYLERKKEKFAKIVPKLPTKCIWCGGNCIKRGICRKCFKIANDKLKRYAKKQGLGVD